MLLNKKVLFFLFYVIAFISAFAFLFYITYDFPLCYEDTMYSRLGAPLKDTLRDSRFLGGYIAYFLLFFPPEFLNRHVYETVWIWRSFEYIVLLSSVFLFSRFLKSGIIRLFGFSAALLFVLYYAAYCPALINSAYVFSRYILALALFLIFELSFFKNYLDYNCENKKYSIISAAAVFFLSASTEIFIIEIIVQLILIYTAEFFTKKCRFSLILLSGIAVNLIINLIYNNVLVSRKASAAVLHNAGNFFSDFISYALMPVSSLLCLILLLAAFSVFIFLKNRHDYKPLLFAAAALAANFTAAVLLGFFDWSMLFRDKIIIIYYFNLLIPVFALVSYIYKNTGAKKTAEIIFSAVFIMYALVFLKSSLHTLKYMLKIDRAESRYTKQLIYQYEKALRFAGLSGSKAVLYLEPAVLDSINDFFDDSKILTAGNELLKDRSDKSVICFDKNGTEISIIRVIEISHKYGHRTGFCISNDKEKMIRNKLKPAEDAQPRALITEEELEKLNFTRLKDDNFILQQ